MNLKPNYTNYINGTWESESNSKVPIYDGGFLLGDGLFETIRFDKQKLFYPEKHIKLVLKIVNFCLYVKRSIFSIEKTRNCFLSVA